MNKFKWENGILIQNARVNVNGTIYDVEPAQFEGETPLSAENLNAMQDALINLIYPVGAIYISTNNTNPALMFGGTWERIKDKFLLSAGDNYEAGETGGEATHLLTIDEMPRHYHDVTRNRASGDAGWGGLIGTNSVDGVNFGVQNTSEVGNNVAHNNMPPYLTVYMWKRVD